MGPSTRFTELAGCRVPVQQAPMGSVSTAALAVAVAEAGGVGSITALGLTAEQVDNVLAGMTARAAAEAGCDVVAVQGTEAGGHVRGDSPLWPLLESVLGQVKVPVLAAGGIGDARAFAAALAAGAAGVRAGTRFVATAESGAHPAYKQAVTDAAAGATEITGAFSVFPLCATSPRARVLSTCVGALRDLDGEVAGQTTTGGRRITLPRGHGLPPGTAATGHLDAMPMYAGESAAAISAVEPAAQIIATWAAAVRR